MAANRYFVYENQCQARAFIDGVQYVNDSALEIYGLYLIPKEAVATLDTIDDAIDQYVVHIVDTTKESAESDPKPAGLDSVLTKQLKIE